MPTLSGTKSGTFEKILPQGEVDCFRKSIGTTYFNDQSRNRDVEITIAGYRYRNIGLTFAWSQLMPEKGKFRLGEAS